MLSSREFLDFVCVGVVRSGTTWIAEALSEHPQVFVPPAKELNFFNDVSPNHLEFKYLRGIDYYREQFRKAPPETILGELTPTYYFDPNAASRIHEHFPNVRILLMLRNPAEVAFSTYLKRREYGKIEDTFEEALKNSPNLTELGFYHRLLEPYFELFPREQIHVAIYESFFSDPAAHCAALYRFLGVDDSFAPSVLNRQVNPRREVRSQLVVDLLHRLRRLANAKPVLPLKRLVTRGDFLGRLSEKVVEANLKQGSPSRLLPETRDRLMAQYAPDIAKLENMLQMDLQHWQKRDSE